MASKRRRPASWDNNTKRVCRKRSVSLLSESYLVKPWYAEDSSDLYDDSIWDSPLSDIIKPRDGKYLLDTIRHEYEMPEVWTEMFEYVPNIHTEILFDGWRFYCLSTLEEEMLSNRTQNHWIPIAKRSCGGTYERVQWYFNLCYEKDLQKWFIIREEYGNHLEANDTVECFYTNADKKKGFSSKDDKYASYMMDFREFYSISDTRNRVNAKAITMEYVTTEDD